jgi:hypothetical protein
MSDPKHPSVGDVIIDASGIPLKNITPDRIRQLTKVRDGYGDAIQNVLQLKTEDVERAGLNPSDIQRLASLAQRDTHIGQLHAASEKLTEMLYETRLEDRHEIGTLLGEFAAQARRRADRVANGAEVLGPLETLLQYQSGPALQGAATKKAEKEESGGG